MRRATLALISLLIGCRPHSNTTDPSAGDSGNGYTFYETGLWVDTANHDTAPADTGDTADEPPEAAVTSLALYPRGLTVQPGATWSLRLVAHWEDGTVDDVADGVLWSSDRPDVIAVDDAGVATAVGTGLATLSAVYGGRQATTTLTVSDDMLLHVVVQDATTGDPLAGASLVVGEDGPAATTDASGQTTAEVSDGGPITFTVWMDGYVPVTIWQTVSRQLVVPLIPESVQNAEDATIEGNIDFSYVPSGHTGQITIGIAVPSMVEGPLLYDLGELMAPDRTVSIYGIDAELPANLYLKGHAEDYQAMSPAGSPAVWTVAGPIPISELTSDLSGTGDALGLLRDHLSDLVWGWNAGGSVAAGGTLQADLAPSDPFTDTYQIDQGGLTLGFEGNEDTLVLVGPELDHSGLVVTGIGLGTGVVDVLSADPDIDDATNWKAVDIAQVGGLGSGGATCVSVADLDRSADLTTLPSLQVVPDLVSFDGASRQFALTTDGRARLSYVVIRGGLYHDRIVLLDGGSQAGVLPDPGFEFGYGRTKWHLVALETIEGTFEDFVSSGTWNLESVAADSRTAARVDQEF